MGSKVSCFLFIKKKFLRTRKNTVKLLPLLSQFHPWVILKTPLFEVKA